MCKKNSFQNFILQFLPNFTTVDMFYCCLMLLAAKGVQSMNMPFEIHF